MNKWFFSAILIGGATTVLLSCSGKEDNPVPSYPEESKVTDYSQTASWYQIPEIMKDFDTFYIPATEYINSSYNEGAPDFATLDNAEMLELARG